MIYFPFLFFDFKRYYIPSSLIQMADFFSSTRDDRRERIVAAGNSVRQALQDLLSEYMENAGTKPTEMLDEAIHNMLDRTRNLRKQLRKAVVDHVSDGFLEPGNPLLMLIEAAKGGHEKEVEEFAGIFTVIEIKIIRLKNNCFVFSFSIIFRQIEYYIFVFRTMRTS